MKVFLRYSLVALLAMVMGKLSAQEVTLDFTLTDTDADNSTISVWGFPVGSSNKVVDEQSFTYGDYTVKVAGSTGQGYYWNNKDHYLLFGKQGATVTLPAFTFDVQRIEIEGNGGASASVLQNIYVGENAVSTETTGAQGTNTYDIAADYQTAGNVYVIKVNSNHNSQIKTIKVWKKGTVQEETVPVADNIAAFTALGNGTEAELKLDGAKVTYVSPDGKSVYVRDATGGMCFYNQDAFANASNKWELGGSLKGKVYMRNNMTQMTITDATALTYTEGAEYAPVAVTLSEVSSHVADLIKLTEDFTVTNVDGKFYNNENKDVQLYDNFRLGYTVSDGDVLKDLTGVVIMYNTQVEIAPTVEPTIVTPPALILTLKAAVGEEVSLTFGVWDTEDEFSVDFGDGTLQTAKVGIDNKGPANEDGTTGSATKFAGTVAGDGTIKVYGNNDIWYFLVSGKAVPTTLDQPKLMNVVQMGFTGVDVESVVLPAYKKMTQFSCNNSPVKSVDVSAVPTLTSLTINNTSASKFEPQLESIDLSNNTELTYLSLQCNQNNYGKLTSLDLTNNTKLQGMGLYVQYNQIAELKLPAEWAADEVTETQTITYGLTAMNVQNNQLAVLNTANLKKMKNLYAADNQLSSIDVSGMADLVWLDVKNNKLAGDLDLTANTKFTNVYLNNNELTSVKVNDVTKQFYVDGNKLTLATLPAQPASMNTTSKTKQFHYAPQADLEVAETVTGTLDLSAQASVKKGELNTQDYTTWLSGATTFTVKTVSGTALTEGTDYSIDGGVITFLAEQSEKVYVEMLNTAFPKFTATTPFKTTEFTVPTPVGIHEVNVAHDANKMYNLQGVEVTKAGKGLYILNGKKVIVK